MPLRRKLLAVGAATMLAAAVFADSLVASEDPYKVAQRLAAAASLRQGDLVLLSGDVRHAALLEQVAAYARSVGAHPVLTLDSERLYRPRPMLAQARLGLRHPASASRTADTVVAQIIIEFGEKPAAHADEQLAGTFYSRSVRQVYLENDRYPTRSNTELHGVVQPDLAKAFREAVASDTERLLFSASALRSVLVGSKELRVGHPNGTDLKLRVDGRPVFASDGAISRADAMDGGGARVVWHPAGEVYLVPVAGSAEGTVVVDRQIFQGKEIQGLALHYKAGRLTSMTARSGLEPLKALYDAAGPGRDVLGVIDISIDPAARGSRFLSAAPAGLVTLYLGNNLWAGGYNSAGFALGSLLRGTTVAVDGRVVVENGALKALPAGRETDASQAGSGR